MNDGKFADKVARRAHGMINKEREKRNVPPLRGRKPLIKAAESHSREMAKQGEIFHKGTDGTPQSRAPRGYRRVAENVAYVHERDSTGKAARKLVDNWLNSTGHRKNMLDSRNKYDGLGIWVKGGRVYATHMMARKATLSLKTAKRLRSITRRATPPYSLRERQVVYGSAYGALAFLGAAAITGSGDVALLNAGDLVEHYLSVRTAEFPGVAADNRGRLVEYIIRTPTLAVAFASVLCAVSISGTNRPRYLIENTAPAAGGYLFTSLLFLASRSNLSQETALGFVITAVSGGLVGLFGLWLARKIQR